MTKDRIKVAFFLPNLDMGGAEKITMNLLNNISRNDFEIVLLLGEKRGYFLDKLPKDIRTINLKTRSNLGLFWGFRIFLRKEKPDIFVSVFPRFNVISLVAKIFTGGKTKIIIAEHTTFSCVSKTAKTAFRRIVARHFFPFLMKLFYPKASAVICVSRGVADDILKVVNIPNKVKIIYNPILDKIIFSSAKKIVNHPWFHNKENPLIIAVGRLVQAKDYPNLLKAFALIDEKLGARLVIIGEGPEREKIEGLIEKLKIRKKTLLLGFQENPYKYLAKSSVFVLSSSQEGFATVIIEAMACCLPVVSTNCPSGSEEIITDAENGFLVPTNNPESLCRAISSLLENSKLRKKFSVKNKKIIENFSIEKGVKRYEELFKSFKY